MLFRSLASRQEMLSDSKLNSHLNSSWDNIILGNRLHFDRWLARFHGMFSISREASKTAVLKRDGAAALAGMATNVTVVGFVLGSAWLHRQNTASALALLVMLPRSLQIVLHIQIVQSYWAQWKSLRERLQLVLHGLADPADRSLSPFIQGDKIEILRLEGEQKLNLPELISLMNEKAPRGRVLVTGPNGSGKSTFLLDLKKQSRERSIYLPPQSDLEHSDSSSEFSSGQAMLSLLKDLEKNDAEILLLDEWDANLSDENCLSQERLIERLAETRLVIEIRHGRKNS